MIYDRIIKYYLTQDNNSEIPLVVRFYMLISPSCRREVKMLKEQFESMKSDSSFKMEIDLTYEVMNKIYKLEVEYDHTVSSLKWFFVGFILFSSIVLVPFSNSLIWLKTQFGSSLEVPFSIVMGFALTIYATLYIGSHLEQLKKNIEGRLKKYHWFD